MELVERGRAIKLPFVLKAVQNVIRLKASIQMPKQGVERFRIVFVSAIIHRLQNQFLELLLAQVRRYSTFASIHDVSHLIFCQAALHVTEVHVPRQIIM